MFKLVILIQNILNYLAIFESKNLLILWKNMISYSVKSKLNR